MKSSSEQQESRIPKLLYPQSQPSRKILGKFFNFLGQWRVHLYKKLIYSKEGAKDRLSISKTVDELLSLVLLFYFIRQKNFSALPSFKDIVNDLDNPSVNNIARAVQVATNSALLKAVFDPNTWSDDQILPAPIIELPLESSISDAMQQVYCSQVPITIFGDFQTL